MSTFLPLVYAAPVLYMSGTRSTISTVLCFFAEASKHAICHSSHNWLFQHTSRDRWSCLQFTLPAASICMRPQGPSSLIAINEMYSMAIQYSHLPVIFSSICCLGDVVACYRSTLGCTCSRVTASPGQRPSSSHVATPLHCSSDTAVDPLDRHPYGCSTLQCRNLRHAIILS